MPPMGQAMFKVQGLQKDSVPDLRSYKYLESCLTEHSGVTAMEQEIGIGTLHGSPSCRAIPADLQRGRVDSIN